MPLEQLKDNRQSRNKKSTHPANAIFSQTVSRIRRWFYNASISTKIYLLNICIILLAVILLGFVSAYVSTRLTISETEKNSIQNLKLISQSLNNILESAEEAANIIIPYPEIQDAIHLTETNDEIYKPEIQQYLLTIFDNIIDQRNLISNAVMVTKDDIIVVSGKGSYYQFLRELENDTLIGYRDLIYGNKSLWFDLHPYTYHHSHLVQHAVSLKKNVIYGLTGEKKAVLVLNINERVLAGSYSDISYGKSGKYFIVNRANKIVSSSNKGELYIDISDMPYASWLKTAHLEGAIFKIDDRKHLCTAATIDKLNWSIVGLIPINEVLADQHKIILLIIGIGCLLILLASTLMLLTTRTISRPLIELTQKVIHLGKGHFDVTLDVMGEDEIGTLTKNFNKMTREISELIEINYKQNIKQKEYEFAALQAQINPHFLYNTLESICSLIQMKESDEAITMTKALSQFYRSSLSKGSDIITIGEEIDNIISYLTIQKKRYGSKLDYEINIDEGIQNSSTIKLSIQPIVENAIYHGIKPKKEGGRILIIGQLKKDYISISIIDDGIGMSQELVKKIKLGKDRDLLRNSFGILSVDERIKLVYGKEYGLKIESEPDIGTKVDILLPFEKSTEVNND